MPPYKCYVILTQILFVTTTVKRGPELLLVVLIRLSTKKKILIHTSLNEECNSLPHNLDFQ